MHPDNQRASENRVTSAAEAALAHHHYVSAIGVLRGTGLLSPAHLQEWRKGRIDFLERLSRPPERVAFLILRDSRCSECGIELEQGSLL